MPKEVPFHELHKKVKRRKLISEDIEESNSTDFSMVVEQSNIQQPYDFVTSRHSKVPDFLHRKKKSELAHHSELVYHSEFAHQSEFSSFSDYVEYSEHSEHFDNEYGDILYENIDSDESLPRSPPSSISSCSRSSKNSVSANLKVLQFLRGWALKHNITHEAISDLLKGLKENHECFTDDSETIFPINARTLLKTEVKLIKKVVKPGYYIHIGLQNQLLKIAFKYLKTIDSFKLLINIDGLPLFRSSSDQVYPILCTVVSIPELRKKVFPIGIYYGKEKPTNLVDFLTDFIVEINSLRDNGLHFENHTTRLDGIYFVCDAPAKSFIMGTVSHTGFYSCTRCTVQGMTSDNRRIFIDFENPARTNDDFLQWKDQNFRRRYTPLINIAGLDFVHHFILDYLHLQCLGIMRSMIMNMWYQGPIPHRLSAAQVELVSNLLVQFQNFIPVEFARKCRELYIVSRWKATEFRLFFLYIGPIVLKNVLSKDKYLHFLEFHFAMRILLNVDLCKSQKLRQFAKDLLKHFVKSTVILYGQNYISHNFHNNIHIADDADYFVDKLKDFSLDTISAFPFENYLQDIKRKIRGRSKPLEQIGRRIGEIMSFESNYLTEKDQNNQYPRFYNPHNTGPLLPSCTRQYRGVVLPKFKITNQSSNNCCGTAAGNVIQIKNIAFCESLKVPVVIGREFLNKCDFYTIPSESSRVGVFKVNKLSNLKMWPLSEITSKYVQLPYKNGYVVLSILHCNTF